MGNELKFFEVLEGYPVSQLSRLACYCGPCGGDVVHAKDEKDALNLWLKYRNGARYLMRDLYLKNEDYPIKNIIYQ